MRRGSHDARMLVRHALGSAACAAICAPYVTGGGVSFEDVAPSVARIAETGACHPWLVLGP